MRRFLLLLLPLLILLVACKKPEKTGSLDPELRFVLKYGSFEDEINLFTNPTGDVNTFVVMRDGLFYIVNGESRKIAQFNSYGDLLSFHYNPDGTPPPVFELSPEEGTVKALATQRSRQYPFVNPGMIAVDSRKYLYVVDQVPRERQERDTAQRLLLAHVVFRFGSDGTFLDYIGQQGPGGTPFPYIKNIYTTKNNELVVVCQGSAGMIVYWYSPEGFLLYTVPLNNADLPGQDETDRVLPSLKKVLPDGETKTLYVDIDYYTLAVDTASGVQYGTEYTQTLVHSFDMASGEYGQAIQVPPFEEKERGYSLTWDLLGLTDSGYFFFMLIDDLGYNLQIIPEDGTKIQRHHLELGTGRSGALVMDSLVYSAFSLSAEGIISALLADEQEARVVWWRCDLLLAPSALKAEGKEIAP